MTSEGERDYGKYWVRHRKRGVVTTMAFVDEDRLNNDFGEGTSEYVDNIIHHGQTNEEARRAIVEKAEDNLRQLGIDPDKFRKDHSNARIVDV